MRRGVVIFWSIFIAAVAFRLWQSFGVHPPDIGSCLKQVVEGTGRIAEEPSRTETGQILVVSAEKILPSISAGGIGSECPTDFLIRMKTKLYPRFAFNDRVSFKGKLLEPMNFSGGSSGRDFDYRGYLAKDEVYYEMKSAVVATLGGDGRTIGVSGTKISAILYSLKRSFVSNLENSLGEPHAALAAGLVVGEKAALGKDLLNDFRTVGLIHIVVLSGYNITIVAAAMRRLLGSLPRVWGIVIGGIGMVLFCILVGGGATVVRSCFMAGVALSADLIRRDYSVIRALLLAALIMLIQNPMILLHDPSFQLSFLATLGLILLASPIEEQLRFIPESFGLRGVVAATLATQIFVSPYILYMMGQISIIGMLVNIIVLPFIPLTMLLVFLTGASGMVLSAASHIFGWGAHMFLSYELFIVERFARLPFAAAHLPPFSFWWVVGFYTSIGFIFALRKSFFRSHPNSS